MGETPVNIKALKGRHVFELGKTEGNLMPPSRGLMIDFNQVPRLTPEATACRHYRGLIILK